jgi:signal transduction histidine kinase
VIVRKESLRARDITTRLLSFAHQQPGSRGSVRLDRELTEVAAMLAHQAQQRGVRLDLETSGPQRPILGDSGELRQVLFNLLKNALDASPDGGVIRCRCTTVDGRVELTVDDQGAGVPGPLREQIFEPFFTTKAPGQGTGLGLAIAHRIVTAHGGSLAVGDAPGGGARFRVELAAAPK